MTTSRLPKLSVHNLLTAPVTELRNILDKLIDLRSYPVKDELSALLKDKTSGKNIIFATDS